MPFFAGSYRSAYSCSYLFFIEKWIVLCVYLKSDHMKSKSFVNTLCFDQFSRQKRALHRTKKLKITDFLESARKSALSENLVIVNYFLGENN